MISIEFIKQTALNLLKLNDFLTENKTKTFGGASHENKFFKN